MIPLVAVTSPRHAESLQRLVKHCRNLDGTEINVIESKEADDCGNKYEAAYIAFQTAARTFKDQPFFWIEADAIPLRKGFQHAFSVEYELSQKPFLLPDLSRESKFDVASGIGIYPPNVIDLIPDKKPDMPWLNFDHWIYGNLREQIHFTNLIQHSYCLYSFKGQILRRHEFPQDGNILRPEALVFHSDPTQSLIAFQNGRTNSHS